MFSRLVRLFKHRWADDSHHLISPALAHRLAKQVAHSERSHTGEIRVCVESGLPNRYLLRSAPTPLLVRQRAVDQFGMLGVWDTESNNGVLIYLLLAENAIELVADRGLTTYVSPEAWAAMVQDLGAALRLRHYEQGLAHAIDAVSTVLAAHFPAVRGANNPNELPNAVLLL